jgi:ABC-type branched-subunit amino acid transport system permease subunit
MEVMGTVMGFLLGAALLSVLASLLAGVIVMARGGQGDARQSNRLMRLRVILQGIALVLFVLAMLTQAS